MVMSSMDSFYRPMNACCAKLLGWVTLAACLRRGSAPVTEPEENPTYQSRGIAKNRIATMAWSVACAWVDPAWARIFCPPQNDWTGKASRNRGAGPDTTLSLPRFVRSCPTCARDEGIAIARRFSPRFALLRGSRIPVRTEPQPGTAAPNSRRSKSGSSWTRPRLSGGGSENGDVSLAGPVGDRHGISDFRISHTARLLTRALARAADSEMIPEPLLAASPQA